MFVPVPLIERDEGLEGCAGRLLDSVRRADGWPLERRAAVLWSVRRRVAEMRSRCRTRRSLRAALVVAPVAALVVALLALRPSSLVVEEDAAGPLRSASRWNRLDLPDIGTLELASDEGFEVRELAHARELRIGLGTLRAEIVRQDPERPLVVVTPHLRVVVVGTRFDVQVAAERTAVELIEGRVRVETPGAAAMLEAGMSIRSDDAALSAPTPNLPAAPATPSAPAPARAPRHPRAAPRVDPVQGVVACERLEAPAAQRACYGRLSQGSDLAAQNALFALGLIARDVERRPSHAAVYFAQYRQRFPDGVLAPEATLGLLEVLKDLGRTRAAIEVARAFEDHFDDDARAPEVALVRAELLCREGERLEGRGIVGRIAARGDPSLEATLERARQLCAPRTQGNPDAAACAADPAARP